MRTKALVLAAAVSAVSIVSALAADPVYSVNVVGYVTKSLVANQFTILSTPLIATNDAISTLIPTAPEFSMVYKYNGSAYESSTFDGVAWDPALTLPVGTGFWVLPTDNMTVTFVGEVAQREQSNGTIPSGFSLIGSKVPAASTLNAATFALPFAQNFEMIYKYTPAGYQSSTHDGSAWDPDLSIDVGEGFWYLNPGAAMPWTRNFIVQ